MKDLITWILLCFEANHELARAKRAARRAGVDPETDEEFRRINEI
jgi:hypothetical protein